MGDSERHRPGCAGRSPAWPTSRSPRAAARRDGDRQGARGAGASTTPAAGAPVRSWPSTSAAIPPSLVASELFGAARGRLHRLGAGAGRVLPQGPRRHAVPRRDRRGAPRGAGDAAAGAGDRRDPAGRRARPAAGGRAGARRHRRRPRGARRGRASSARRSSTGSPATRSGCRRCGSGATTSAACSSTSCARSSRPPARAPAGPSADAALWVPPQLVARLARYDWPGNVRQLRNIVRQLVIGSRGLPGWRPARPSSGCCGGRRHARTPAIAAAPPLPMRREPASPPPPGRRKPADVSEDELIAALRAHRWDLQATAAQLRISRPSLYALIEALAARCARPAT